MPVHRLNHAVLYVRNVERTVSFYVEVLDFSVIDIAPKGFRGAAFLRAPASTNDHDLGVFQIGDDAEPSMAGRTTVGLYHLAWEVETLDDLDEIAKRLSHRNSLTGATDHGTTKSLYGTDPDGLEFEIAWVVPADLLDETALENRKRLGHLDLQAEKVRYGATTQGGIGISRPRPAG